MATYYVATPGNGGNDSNPGTLDSPWATWQKGFTSLSAGDTLYIRGGTYTPSTTYGNGRDNCVYVTNKHGTSGNRINVSNYGTEIPILRGTNLPSSNTNKSGIHLYDCSYWTITGLIVEYIEDTGGSTNFGIGWYIGYSDYITLDRCVSRYNNGPGFAVNGFSDYGYFINCDSYWNVDNHDNGGFADGFIASHYDGESGYHSYFQYCRAWNNSDDGFDAYISDSGNHGGYIEWDHCWSFRNGLTSPSGNGAGIKWAGGDEMLTQSELQRVVKYCICAGNKAIGFDQSAYNPPGYVDFLGVVYNNLSYDNGSQGFYNDRNSVCYFRNNISYDNTGANWVDQTNFIDTNNTWNGVVTVSGADFTGLDINELDDARQSDGSLPNITSFKLVEGSDLIDAGTTTIGYGIIISEYSGSAPDMGPFEFEEGEPPVEEGFYVKSKINKYYVL